MKQFHFITIHPEIIDNYTSVAVFKRATLANQVIFKSIPLRQFAVDQRGTIDDRPYGGGDGMVMRPDCLASAVKSIPEKPYVILTSPKGKTWTQKEAKSLVTSHHSIAFVCGRYDGIDQRFIDRYVDAEYSLGQFILAGGELAALSMAESMIRLLPHVLGNEESAENDSLSEKYNGQLEHPLYTRPPEFEGMKVPDVLLSGDHHAIEMWRKNQRRTAID